MIDLDSVRGWVLDIDDTLYLEREYVRSGFAAVGRWIAETRHIQGFENAAIALFERGVRGNIFDRAAATLGLELDSSLIAALVQVYRTHTPDIRLAADAAAFLSRITGRLPIGIVSDGPLDSQSRKVEALGLAAMASPVILTEAHGPGYRKPSPRAFRDIEACWKLTGRSLVYVADNLSKDFEGPRALGWQTVRMARPEGLHFGGDTPHALVDLTVKSFSALGPSP